MDDHAIEPPELFGAGSDSGTFTPFLFGLDLAAPDPFGYLTDLGVDLRHVLHGEQAFTYHAMAHAGDRLTASPTITDIYTKRNGTLEFIVRHTTVTRNGDERVADLEDVTIVRHPGSRT